MPAGGMILRATSLLELNLYVLPLYIGWLIITIIIITIIINFDLWFMSFASFSGRDAATAWASYCGPVRARSQHQELRALLFTNSVWVL